jgi:hypothetical protein
MYRPFLYTCMHVLKWQKFLPEHYGVCTVSRIASNLASPQTCQLPWTCLYATLVLWTEGSLAELISSIGPIGSSLQRASQKQSLIIILSRFILGERYLVPLASWRSGHDLQQNCYKITNLYPWPCKPRSWPQPLPPNKWGRDYAKLWGQVEGPCSQSQWYSQAQF